jgi:DNA-directed RNA polymerase specialized sigma24 family protein
MSVTTRDRWDLSPEQLQALHQRYQDTRDRRLADRILAVLLKAEKHWPHQEIASLLGIHPDTVTQWLQTYLQGGLDGL